MPYAHLWSVMSKGTTKIEITHIWDGTQHFWFSFFKIFLRERERERDLDIILHLFLQTVCDKVSHLICLQQIDNLSIVCVIHSFCVCYIADTLFSLFIFCICTTYSGCQHWRCYFAHFNTNKNSFGLKKTTHPPSCNLVLHRCSLEFYDSQGNQLWKCSTFQFHPATITSWLCHIPQQFIYNVE